MIKSSTKFRYDINALRAIAVIGVLLFHFKVPYLGGGFSGVDIFFVISGYLMTRIILNGINKNSFSFLEFYGKRVKRIVPALLVLVFGITILGFFFYFPVDYMLNEKNATASILFLSNMFYLKNSGYFDPSSETNILLHTWSLSVEWQFYLIYPVILFIINRIFKDKSRYTLFFILTTFVIMLLSMYLTKRNASASFYILPTRSWEMMFGGIAFLLENSMKNIKARKFLSIIGYLSLLFGLCLLNVEMEWPGVFTFIPVFSTFLIIISNYNDFSILQNNVVQFFGKISYSLYLWHWPVYVVSRYFGIETTAISMVSLLTLSIALGYLSYKYVESVNLKSNKFILATMTAMVAITFFLGYKATNVFMFKPRSIELANYKQDPANRKRQFSAGCCFISSLHNGSKDYNKLQCLNIRKDKKNILLIGDSHAAQLSLSLRNTLIRNDINLLQATSSGCLPLKKLNGALRCSEIMDYVYNDFIKNNAQKIDGILISANWVSGTVVDSDKMIGDIKSTIKYLNGLNIPVLLIGQNETYNMPYPSIIAKENEYGFHMRRSQLNIESYRANQLMLAEFKSKYINIINIDVFPEISSSSSPYMFDENHFTEYGAALTTKKILSDPKVSSFFKIKKV